MYKILDNPVELTAEEIYRKFDEKWVFIVNCKFTTGMGLISGTPVVVADEAFEGVEEGIYIKYKDKKYGKRHSCTLFDTGRFQVEVKGDDGKFHRLF